MSKILWTTWKDHKHPGAGGAELVARELTLRMAAEGHDVTVLTCGYPGAPATELEDGIRFIRVGSSRYFHPFQAMAYYVQHMRGRFDVVIEEIEGCAPYFIAFFERRAKRFLLYHQLGRINWLYEVPKPFSYIGYKVAAPAATRLIAMSKAPVITVSESTRNVLARYGFSKERTHIISEGLPVKPLKNLHDVTKYARPTVLSFGAMRAMKRTIDQIKAFEIARQQVPDLQMKIGGSTKGSYGNEVLRYIENSPYRQDIEVLGKVSTEAKAELMQKSHIIFVTSVEEGWGLTVSEANGQGTPAVVYDVSGLRDSVRHGETGIVTEPDPRALAAGAVELMDHRDKYERLRRNAWRWSKELTFDRSYADFKNIIGVTE